MSRKKTKINPIRAERVKKIIERAGISQSDFATRISQTQQNVSRIINLKTALTEETAQDIVSAFPEYRIRIEWLLGYDDDMTDEDHFMSTIETGRKETEILENALFGLARLSGFTIAPTKKYPDRSVESIIGAIKTGLTFSRDGKSVSFSLAELNAFENEICDYVEMRLNRMLK